MIISVVICEGPHDVAFISKIMAANEYSFFNKTIGDFPYPINDYLKGKIRNSRINPAEMKVKAETSYAEIPMEVMENGKKLILFYKMGGDGSRTRRKNTIQEYLTIWGGLEFKNPQSIDALEFYLFYDADDVGVKYRLDEATKLLKETFNVDGETLKQGESVVLKVASKEAEGAEKDVNVRVGTYIFHSSADDKGTLEDVLIEMMKSDNASIFTAAESYLDSNRQDVSRQKEYDIRLDKYKGSSKYRHKKSIISVAGQLLISGMSNQVIIAKTDYLKKDKVLVDNECKSIFRMIDKS